MSKQDSLRDLCDEVNQQWNEDVERVVNAICARLDRMDRFGGKVDKEESKSDGDAVGRRGQT